MDKFLQRHNLRKFTNMNSSITIKVVEFLVQNLPTKETPGPSDFTGKFYY